MTVAAVRRLHVPLRAAADAIPHLGAAHHWREGRSPKSLVDQWWTANALPLSVRNLLDQAQEWQTAELIDAYVERQTKLEDDRPSPSQSDLLAIVGIGDKLGVIVIEAKVDEGFDKTVSEWRAVDSKGKAQRLQKLCSLLGLDTASVAPLRYQLLHRTASAVLEARRYRAAIAAVIVQSWCPRSSGSEDFAAFLEALGITYPGAGQISAARQVGNVMLRFGWSAEAA